MSTTQPPSQTPQPQPLQPGQHQTPAVLPDKMPDSWVEQVASVVKSEKPKIWFTLILGSSLLAAMLNLYSSCSTNKANIAANKELAKTNIAASRELEGVKARQDAQKALVLIRQKAYLEIKQTLDDLVLKLQSFTTAVQIAQSSPVNATTQKRFNEEVMDAGKAQRKVIETIGQKSEVNELAVIREVGGFMGELSQALSAAKANPQASLTRIESDKEKVRQLGLRVQEQVSQEIENMH